MLLAIFYGTEINIWAGFRPVGSTEKKIWPIISNFWGRLFSCFHGQKKFSINIVASALKSCIKKGEKNADFFLVNLTKNSR